LERSESGEGRLCGIEFLLRHPFSKYLSLVTPRLRIGGEGDDHRTHWVHLWLVSLVEGLVQGSQDHPCRGAPFSAFAQMVRSNNR